MNWLKQNWLKLVICLFVFVVIFTYYQYFQTKSLKQCAEFGMQLDNQLKQDIQKNGGSGQFITSTYKFKNNTCFREVEYAEYSGEVHLTINNAYTHENLANCLENQERQPEGGQLCDKYHELYNDIFGTSK
jgi:hypothetical protein